MEVAPLATIHCRYLSPMLVVAVEPAEACLTVAMPLPRPHLLVAVVMAVPVAEH